MHFDSNKSIFFVVALIAILAAIGFDFLYDDEDAELAINDMALAGQAGPLRRTKRSRLKTTAFARSTVAAKPETFTSPTLVLSLTGENDGAGPKEARLVLEAIDGVETSDKHWQRVAMTTTGKFTLRNLPPNKVFIAKVEVANGFPCVVELRGPKSKIKAVRYDLPFVERRVRARLFGAKKESLYNEWVTVDLFSGRQDSSLRSRTEAQRVDKNGWLTLQLFHPPKGEFHIRLMQDEGKEMSLMTRSWSFLPVTSGPLDLGDIQLQHPPFFASGKVEGLDGQPLRFTCLEVYLKHPDEDRWVRDPSMSTSANVDGKWLIRAEYGFDVIRVIPRECNYESREDLILPRGTQDFAIRMFLKEETPISSD